jgi:nucleoside-diphosphate-sugar epimerase
MKVVITGAKGFIGQELVAQCEAEKIDVVKIDTVEDTAPGYYKIDVNSNRIGEVIPKGSDAIIHLAALSRDGDCRGRDYNTFMTNVMGTLNLMQAAHDKQAGQFIFASTEWVYDKFELNEIKDEDSLIDVTSILSEYALSKLVSEVNLRQRYNQGFCPVMILRFGIVYGPRETNWSAVEALFHGAGSKDLISVGSLRTGRCFIHVSDLCAGIVKSIGFKGFNLLNLQGDKLITLRDIIECSKSIHGKNPEVTEKDPNNASVRNISNERAKSLLGWQLRFDIEKGLRSLLTS